MASPESLIKRARKLERRESFLTLLEAIGTHALSASERSKLLGRIMAATSSGAISPHEGRKLTKAIGGNSDRKKKG